VENSEYEVCAPFEGWDHRLGCFLGEFCVSPGGS
jgi:hypothetical protein